MKNNTIHLLMSGDRNVYEGIALCMLSAVKQTNAPIHLHLMTVNLPDVKGISDSDAKKLRAVMQAKNPGNDLELIDATKDYMNSFVGTPNSKPAYSPCSLLRLFADKYLRCEKVIYLDADIMICDSLEKFNKINIDNIEMAATHDVLGRYWINKSYFNSGVLYINMKRIRETRCFEKAIKLLQQKHFYFADQTALNKCCKEVKYLPYRFNEQREIKEDTVVKHFNKGLKWFPIVHFSNVKQWQREQVHEKLKVHDFDDIYEEYDKFYR